jgi:hypothetical protein
MGEFKFQGLPSDVHHCTSHRDGEWITWRCPLCNGYERRLNWKTGKMQVTRNGSTAQHTGFSNREQNLEALQQLNGRHN